MKRNLKQNFNLFNLLDPTYLFCICITHGPSSGLRPRFAGCHTNIKTKPLFSKGLNSVSQEKTDGYRHTYGEDMETIWLY